jgi:hypothetical protein
MKALRIAAGTASLVVVAAWAVPSLAQRAPPGAAGSPPPSSAEGGGYGGPNVTVLGIGFLTLTLAYVPAGVIATASGHSGDGNLGYPLLGPWLDIGSRPACGAGAVPCGVEAGNLTLLVVDGVAQAWGLFAMATSFLVPDHASKSAWLRVAPTRLGSAGYGVAALGTF